MTRRFAIYYAPPPGSELEAFSRRWLGRDHVTGRAVEQPRIDGIDPALLQTITRSARHYGFHATLKAPFALKDDRTAADLYATASDFAASRVAFEAPALRITRLSRWLAYTLGGPSPDMDDLAADCLRAFEGFRAETPLDELERRRAAGLTPRQDKYLQAYGYPYIFEDFHFHMTLAGPLDDTGIDEVKALLGRLAPDLGTSPLTVDAIAVYEQPSRDEPFIQTARLPFAIPRSS